MNKIQKTLKNFGLSENEAKVYEEAVKHDSTSPYELAKLTGIPRTTVYDVVMELSLKGLVELERSDGFKKQQTKIRAKNPSALRSIVRQRHKELNDLEVDIVDILPMLKKDFHGEEANADFQFLPGIEGAKKAYMAEGYEDITLPRFVITNLMPMDAFGKEEVNKNVDDDTYNAGGAIKELIPMKDWTKHVISYQYERDPEYLNRREYRILDNPMFDVYQRMTVMGDRVFISCAVRNEVWGMIINSTAFSKSMLSIFNLLWSQSEKLTVDMVRSWGSNEFLESEMKKKKQ